QALDDLGEPVEGVLEVLRHVGVAEARVVGREDVEAVGEGRDQVPELMRRGGEAAEQEQLRARRGTGFAVEDVQAPDFGRTVADHASCSFRSRAFGWTRGLHPDGRTSYVRGRKNPGGGDAHEDVSSLLVQMGLQGTISLPQELDAESR